MTKKQMLARIAELEATVSTLSAAINSMRTPLYVAPPIQAPFIQPSWPYRPYIGDPSINPWGGSVGIGISTPFGGSTLTSKVECRADNNVNEGD